MTRIYLELDKKYVVLGVSICILQVYNLKVYQSLTIFYLNITSFSKNIKLVTSNCGMLGGAGVKKIPHFCG
jgi:hypothetical protein